MIKMTLGGRLRMLRTENSLTQDEFRDLFEKKTGKRLSIAGYSNYENDNRSPDKETLNLFCDFYNVTMDFLLGRTDNRKADATAPAPIEKKIESIDDIIDRLGERLIEEGLIQPGEQVPEVAARFLMRRLNKMSSAGGAEGSSNK